VQKEKLEKGKTTDSQGNEYDGLYQMPGNLLGVIGGDMSPPLIDPASGSFDNARTGIASAIARDQDEEKRVSEVIAELSKKKAACEKKEGEQAETKVTNMLDSWIAKCGDASCGTDTLTSLKNELGKALGDESDLATEVTGRLSGLGNRCAKLSEQQSGAKDTLLTACSGLSSCKDEDIPQNVKNACPKYNAGTETKSDCTTVKSTVMTALAQVKNSQTEDNTVSCGKLSGKLVKKANDVGDSSSDSKSGSTE
jgi:hypothetical protein